MHIVKDHLGTIIKNARASKGFTQEDLAEKVGIGLRHVSSIENGEARPGYTALEKIIQILDIPADSIFRPKAMTRSLEQEQAIIEFLACSQEEQQLISATVRCMIRELRKIEMQADE
ncbi:helix-turn-helix domain-containing protein [Ruminococcaceae bacterium OttesenSCG-928-L11]|nr:helix-turn-helix domain-containing protein [Ruminococcaceae bacterium OttesenSCG-928-L11]